MADTGINTEQGTKRQHYEDRDTCGALMKRGFLTNDDRAILCLFLHLFFFFLRALVRCSSSAPSRQTTLRDQHSPTSVRGGKISEKGSLFSSSAVAAVASSSLPPRAPFSSGCHSHSGSQLLKTQEHPCQDGGR